MCFTRRLFNSNNLFGISGFGGGMRSTECQFTLTVILSAI